MTRIKARFLLWLDHWHGPYEECGVALLEPSPDADDDTLYEYRCQRIHTHISTANSKHVYLNENMAIIWG